MRTSKILLMAWMAAGLGLLFAGKAQGQAAIVWIAGLAALVWNRLDSRRNGYKATVRVHGVEASIETGANTPEPEPEGSGSTKTGPHPAGTGEISTTIDGVPTGFIPPESGWPGLWRIPTWQPVGYGDVPPRDVVDAPRVPYTTVGSK